MALTDVVPVAVDLEELARRRQELALDVAEGDDGAVVALLEVEQAIAALKLAQKHAALASDERARRAAEAAEWEAQEERDRAMLEARRLQSARERIVSEIDGALLDSARLIGAYLEVGAAQSEALRRAGSRAWKMFGLRDGRLDRSLVHALMLAGVAADVHELMPLSGRPAPLADLDPVPVAPLENEIEEEVGHDGVAAA